MRTFPLAIALLLSGCTVVPLAMSDAEFGPDDQTTPSDETTPSDPAEPGQPADPTDASYTSDQEDLADWLASEGLGFGLMVLPGGYEAVEPECELDPRIFGDSPHEMLLGEGFYAGLGGRTTPAFQDFWDATFSNDWGVDSQDAVGGILRTPSGSRIEDIGWVANRLNGAGTVVDQWLPPAQMLESDGLTSAWFHMEYAGAFEIGGAPPDAQGFVPEAFFVFADFGLLDGALSDVHFGTNTVPPSMHLLLFDGQNYCDVMYVLGPEDFAYAAE